jgi:hypothetical protein
MASIDLPAARLHRGVHGQLKTQVRTILALAFLQSGALLTHIRWRLTLGPNLEHRCDRQARRGEARRRTGSKRRSMTRSIRSWTRSAVTATNRYFASKMSRSSVRTCPRLESRTADRHRRRPGEGSRRPDLSHLGLTRVELPTEVGPGRVAPLRVVAEAEGFQGQIPTTLPSFPEAGSGVRPVGYGRAATGE